MNVYNIVLVIGINIYCCFCVCRVKTTVITAALLPGSLFFVMLCLNSISLYYGTINTIPFSMMVRMLLPCLL